MTVTDTLRHALDYPQCLSPSEVQGLRDALDHLDELIELLGDVHCLEGEERAIGGGPGFKARREAAWRRVAEYFEP